MLVIEMAKIEINRRQYWIYANCRDGQNRNKPAAILNLCYVIEMAKIQNIYANVEMGKIKSSGHIKIMLVIEITKIKLTSGHIEFMLIIEMAKIEINRRPY